jgi:hypothetical protein
MYAVGSSPKDHRRRGHRRRIIAVGIIGGRIMGGGSMGGGIVAACSSDRVTRRITRPRDPQGDASAEEAGTSARGAAGPAFPARASRMGDERNRMGENRKKKVGAWISWIAFSEGQLLVLSLGAYGRTRRQIRSGREGEVEP